MNRREFIKGAFGLGLSLAIPVKLKGKPYFEIGEAGWGGTWEAGETIEWEFGMKDFTIDFWLKVPIVHADKDTVLIVDSVKIDGSEVIITTKEVE